MTDEDVKPTSRSHARDFFALVAGLGFGVLVALGVGRLRSDDDGQALVYAADDRVVSIGDPADLAGGAETPADAIEQFLDAVVDGRSADSLALLSRTDRRRIRTTSSWDQSRHGRIGEVLTNSPIELEVDEATNSAIATTTLELVPSLDPINGLTPPTMDAEWHLVEDDGWRVDVGSSVLTPRYLAGLGNDDVEAAASDWLSEGHACEPTEAAGQAALFRNSRPIITEQLCDGTDAPVVGQAAELDAATANQGFTAAFGAAVRDWARVVPVFQPAPAALVLAPVGDRWIVIDVIAR